MQLYNTLTGKKEPFSPVNEGKVGMYACGITAYDYCHIGHARSAVVFDVLARYLRSLGYDLTFVRNFTDVDDKIINRANEQGVTSKEIAERYIAAFHEDMDRLNVIRADIEPKATEYIDEMISLCQTLIEKGNAYATESGDVYFRVRSFPAYGKLSGRDLDDLRAGARVAPGEQKEDPLDFALWKGAKPGEPSWVSPWGPGRPGWHIECSAMSEKNLPLPLDIHGGGQDLIFPHHENEVAQTEAATGKELSRFWVHNGFVQIDSEKMSKSLNNFKTIRDILESYLPEVLRFFLLTRHYRSPVDFSSEAMDEAEKNLKRLYETLSQLDKELNKAAPKGGVLPAGLKEEVDALCDSFGTAMDDDMNTAAGLGYLNTLVHLLNRVMDDKALRKNLEVRTLLQTTKERWHVFGSILGLLQQSPDIFLDDLKLCRARRNNIDIQTVESLMAERIEARKNKDFAASDALREQLSAAGVIVKDTPDGAVWDIA